MPTSPNPPKPCWGPDPPELELKPRGGQGEAERRDVALADRGEAEQGCTSEILTCPRVGRGPGEVEALEASTGIAGSVRDGSRVEDSEAAGGRGQGRVSWTRRCKTRTGNGRIPASGVLDRLRGCWRESSLPCPSNRRSVGRHRAFGASPPPTRSRSSCRCSVDGALGSV